VAILRAEPTRLGRYGVSIQSDGEELTQLHITLFRSKGRFQLDGDEFTIEPRGFFQNSAELRKGSSIIGRAEKPSFFRRRFHVTSAGHRLTLESTSFRGREYVLLLGNEEVGWIKRHGFTGKKMDLDFPDEVPLFLQVFLAYLVACQAKREAAAAASGS
jgi:hypothetical protein